jgi:hypothetical protein
MTDKARKIMKKMKNWKRLNNPARDRILSDFNQSTLDPVGPVGGDQSMAVLKDMNDLDAGHDEFVKSLAPHVDVV